jgi:hypothetical protein
MPLNLTELIKAAGNAGTAGQSFKSQVTGAADTVGVLSYKIGGLTLAGTLPVDSTELPGAYASGYTFSAIDLTITGYGANAHQIRRPGTTGFNIALTSAPSGAYIVTNSFTEVSASDFDLSITIYGGFSGSFSISAVQDFAIPSTWGDPWSWTYTATQGSPSGSDTMWLDFSYDHDTANFNPTTSVQSYDFDMARRNYGAEDLQYRWFDNSTDATNNTNWYLAGTGSGYAVTSGTSYGLGHPSNERTSVWMRWAPVGGSWSSVVGPTSITGENRNEA